MLALALGLALTTVRPAGLDAWRWSLEDMGWTWQAASADRTVEVFTRPVADAPAPQLWVRTERFEGAWKSEAARILLDCRSGRVAVVEAQDFGGMNLSGVVEDAPLSAWSPPDAALRPILASACGS